MSSIVAENSSNSNDIDCILSLVPWKLKVADKILIAKEIIAKRVSVDEIAPRLHISRSTRYSCAEKFKKHEIMEDGNGRPRWLDEIRVDAIIYAVENNHGMSDQHLKILISVEYVSSYRRQQLIDNEDEDTVQISRRSLKRYFEVFEACGRCCTMNDIKSILFYH